jgi:hypothetical protein
MRCDSGAVHKMKGFSQESALLPTGTFSCAGNYNCLGLADRDRTTIAPRHVMPAPST